MTQLEMFEKSFERQSNFFHLPLNQQRDIDARLGILDLRYECLTEEEKDRFYNHYE